MMSNDVICDDHSTNRSRDSTGLWETYHTIELDSKAYFPERELPRASVQRKQEGSLTGFHDLA